MINKNRLIKLTQRLISIDSQNPPGDEYLIARFVRRYFENIGLKAKIYEFKKRRSNVVVHIQGKDKKHSLLVSPHLDTVPAGRNWRFEPFSAKIHKGRIYGLGATDCKGNLACAMETIHSLVEDKVILDYNLIFAATADEESGSSFGLIPLLQKGILDASCAIVLDSDDFGIVFTQKGLLHLKVKISGKRAHGAYPWRGINAIDKAVDILQAIKSYKFNLPAESRIYRKYLRSPTVNIGTIRGGDKVNVVSDWCEFELDFRYLPGMSANEILKDLRGLIRKYTNNFKLEIEGIQKPYWIDRNHYLINTLSKAMKRFNIKPHLKGSEGATTISFIQTKKIPAVAFGFGSSGCAHVANEYVKIDNLYKGALVLEKFFKIYKIQG